MNDLINFSRNVYSQFGEDGIINEILTRIAVGRDLDFCCVEFGAWDGIKFSNTCRLIRENNYRALLIESDELKHAELLRNFPDANVQTLRRCISFEGENTLDNAISGSAFPTDFDFLSIDVDGVDYHILDSMKDFRPKVICIEFNPTIPNAVDFVQKRDMRTKHGSSAKAICRLADKKGYSLVACTACNLFLIRTDLRDLVIDRSVSLEELNLPGNDPTYLFMGYDGTLLSNKSDIEYSWHGFRVPIGKHQFLPSSLRKYLLDYGFARRQLLKLWLGMKMPDRLWSKIRRRFYS